MPTSPHSAATAATFRAAPRFATASGLMDHYAGVRARLGLAAPARGPEPAKPPLADGWPPQPPAVPYDHFGGAVDPTSIPFQSRWRVIVAEVAQKHRCRPEEIIGPGRSRYMVRARHEACYRLREELQMSWMQIGHKLGHRDHTTCLYGWRRHKAALAGATGLTFPEATG